MRDALRQLGPLLKLTLAVGGCVLALNGGMLALDAACPGWLPQQMAGSGFEQDIRARVHSAEEYLNQHDDERDQLAVVLGLSGAREGVLLAELAQHDEPLAYRYLGLCGAGGTVQTIAKQSQALFTSELQPRLAVLGITPFALIPPAQATADDDQAAQQSDLLLALKQHNPRLLYRALRKRFWFYSRRRDASDLVTAKLQDGKLALLALFGTELPTPPTHRDPWREMIKLDNPLHASQATLNQQLNSYESRGYFRDSAYEHLEPELAALKQMIDHFRGRDRGGQRCAVVLVLMPEHSQLAQRIPPAGVDALTHWLHATYGHDAPPVLNLRQVMPDDAFTDVSHLNRPGSEAFSRLLGAELARIVQ